MHQRAFGGQCAAEESRLTGFAPDTPTLMGALNLANSLGAVGGAITLDAGWGALSTVWAGFVLTTAGLVLYLTTIARPSRRAVPAYAGGEIR
jgi:predicted MFS family arabinose efflux permease